MHRRFVMVFGGFVLAFLIFVPFSILVLDVDYDYTLRTVALGGALLGLVSGVLGTFAVLRHQSLVGDALSHSALPGVAIAFLLTGRELSWLLVGAGIAGWLGVLLIDALIRTTRLKQDAALGIVLTAFFAFGLTLITYIQSRSDASQAGLDSFIFGQAAAIVRQDVLLIGGVGAVAFGVMGAFWKEFKLITFDREFATANGFPVQMLEILLSTLIVVAIVLGLQLAGVILMVGMLIAPAVAARQWTHHLGELIVLAGLFGAFSGAAGAILSAVDAALATGPLIIVVVSSIVFFSLAVAPERGLVWQAWQRYQDRRRFAALNVLRSIYHHALDHQDPAYPAPEGFLRTLHGDAALVGLSQLASDNLIVRYEDRRECWALTPQGIQRAQADAENQKLWQLYHDHGQELHLSMVKENRQQDIQDLLPSQDVQKLRLKGGM